MDATSLAVAISAGVLAAVNPCGFAMLPAYVSMLATAGEEPPAVRVRLLRALAFAGAMTLGFVAVFGAFGALAAPAADWVGTRLPWATIVIGAVLIGLGIWLLAGKELPSPVPKTSAPRLGQRFWPMTLFGMSFAVASLGCTIGPFLAVVVTSFTTDSVATGVGLFAAYAAGMALVVGTVSIAVATAQQGLVTRLRRAAPVVNRVAGALMVLAGAYVAWYGWYEVRLNNGSAADDDPVIDTAARLQEGLAGVVKDIGPGGFALIGGALAVVAVGVAVLLRRRRARG